MARYVKMLAVASALQMLCASTGAFAGSELTPGVSTGLALGAPLPEGLYDITIPTWGSRSTHPATDVGAIVPAWIIWSTPWTLFGGRVGFIGSNASFKLFSLWPEQRRQRTFPA